MVAVVNEDTAIDDTVIPADQEKSLSAPINIRSTSLAILAVIAIIWLLERGQNVFAPLVLGILLSYALYPIVSAAHKLGIPRQIGAALVVLSIAAVSAYVAYSLQGQAINLLDKIPSAVREFKNIQQHANPYEETVLEKLQEAAVEIENVAADAVEKESKLPETGVTRVVVQEKSLNLRNIILGGSVSGLALLAQFLSILLMVFFVLSAGKLYKQKLVKITGSTISEKKLTVSILDEINVQLRRFFFVMFVGVVFVGVLTWLAFWWLGVEQAALWGIIAGVASLIPYVGPIVVFVTTGIVAFLQFGTLQMVLLVAMTSLIITSIQGNLLTPLMTSRTASVNAVVIFISLLFWGSLWGPTGLIVATPILMILKSVCDHVKNLQGIGELLGS